MDNRPQGREKNVTGTGKDIKRRGEGLGTGPVGKGGASGRGDAGRQENTDASGRGYSQTTQRAAARGFGGKGIIIIAIIVIVVLIFGGKSLFGGSGGSMPTTTAPTTSGSSGYQSGYSAQSPSSSSSYGGGSYGGFNLSDLLGSSATGVSSGWTTSANTAKLDTSVDSSARAKYTSIVGGGADRVTIMVYMCGTDLESKSGMGTSDLMEMTAATLSDDVNLLVYTGGCKKWNNNVISSSANQIYKVESGGLRCLVKDDGTSAMTNPKNLTGFINYCKNNYPANRNILIFWNHGGGSLSGYGYDEKYPNSGSMSLKGIDEALKNAGIYYDFIGFDACLMATYENALMLSDYADYLIASEETEPGVGWYYTNWLTALSKNTSMSTLEIGKNIVDDFVDVCAQKCGGQKTTLSVVDLSELQMTTPENFRGFSLDTYELLTGDDFQQVSEARSGTREFAVSNKIDQVDLAHLAYNIGTDDCKALAESLLGAVKYNRTSRDITNAYGLSIYFPYQKTANVRNAVAAYDAIGMDSEYSRCIQQFASMETGGQAISGGSYSAYQSLLGGSGGSMVGSDMISSVLSGLLGGGGTASFYGRGYFDSSVDIDSTAEYLAAHRFNSDALVWTEKNGQYVMSLPEEQWGMVSGLELNVFYYDGEGYIDLGLDNVFEFTDDGELLGEYDGTWLAINDQPVAYYHTDTISDDDGYTITGYVPVLINGDRAELLLVFDSENPYGYISGYRYVYKNGETETVAKSAEELIEGDVIDFICDYYTLEGEYQDSYMLGDAWTYDGDVTISNVYIDADNASPMYLFTDIYCQTYWTPVIPQ